MSLCIDLSSQYAGGSWYHCIPLRSLPQPHSKAVAAATALQGAFGTVIFVPRASEAVKYSLKVQEHFTQRRKAAEAQKTKPLCFAILASWRLGVRLVILSRLPWRGEDAPRRGWKYLLIMPRPGTVLPFIFGSF
jgi:hypothetical protein